MRYADWKKEFEHHNAALEKLRDQRRYRVSDQVDVIVYLSAHPPGFSFQLWHRGSHMDLSSFAHHDFIVITNLHEELTRYVAGGPGYEERDLPDPATWNRPKTCDYEHYTSTGAKRWNCRLDPGHEGEHSGAPRRGASEWPGLDGTVSWATSKDDE